MQVTTSTLYDQNYVRRLFNEMSLTYGWVNLISSFGLARLWRKQCIQLAQIKPGDVVCDMMAGQGEAWSFILSHVSQSGRVHGLDISFGMVSRSKTAAGTLGNTSASVQNALEISFDQGSMDVVVSTFGLKTLSDQQLETLGKQIKNLLKPNGRFSLVEISIPASPFLRIPYMFYLKYVIPIIGKLFLGNPDNYKLLAQYTTLFKNASRAANAFNKTGLAANYKELFFGCASVVYGTKASS